MKSMVLTICLTLMMSAFIYSNDAEAYSRRSSKGPFYIEPYAGYFLGSLKSDNLGDGDIKSLYYGARVGIETAKGFIIGVDYGQGTGEFDPDNNGNNLNGDYVQKDLGAFIGYRVSQNIRLYGSYIFKYESEFERNSGGDLDIEGNGYNAGISIKAHSSLKIGLEYQIRHLKEFGNGSNIPGSDDKSTAYLLTLKLPVPMPFNIR